MSDPRLIDADYPRPRTDFDRWVYVVRLLTEAMLELRVGRPEDILPAKRALQDRIDWQAPR